VSEFNPYQTPKSNLTRSSESAIVLAGRGQRFLAAMVDGIIALVVMIPVMMVLGVFSYSMKGLQPPFFLMLSATSIGFVVFVAIHATLLSRYGQTIGKKALGIRIADMEGNKPPLGTILFKRYLPVSFIGLIPIVGQFLPLIDALFIFRGDRRCLHDLIAGTQVLRMQEAASTGGAPKPAPGPD